MKRQQNLLRLYGNVFPASLLLSLNQWEATQIPGDLNLHITDWSTPLVSLVYNLERSYYFFLFKYSGTVTGFGNLYT